MSNVKAFLHAVARGLSSESIITDDMLVHAYSLDASPYEPKSQAVVDVAGLHDLTFVLKTAAEFGTSLTFRGSGTSVCGQATAEEVVVRMRGDFWRRIEVLDEGRSVRASCMARGGEVNAALAHYGTSLTADPATIGTATIGGMAANNSAGMSCTVPRNIFHKLLDMQLILADGTYLDTANEGSCSRFRSTHAALLDELSLIRDTIRADASMVDRILTKFSIRNTSGYAINAFTEFDDPIDILKHLVIGSEGTLAFIHTVTLETAPLQPLRSTCMVSFSSMDSAIQTVLRIREWGDVFACEFIDDTTLRGLALVEGFPDKFRPQGEVSDDCVLLIELRAATQQELASKKVAITAILNDGDLKFPPEFTEISEQCNRLWAIRSALYPAIAGNRNPGEYEYTEDYCVPIEHLPEACHGFTAILNDLDFCAGVTGHALHGNLHCLVAVNMSDPDGLRRLGIFIEKAADLVLRLNGSLKSEHSSGRAIASFIRREWGDALYDLMKRVKKLFDPAGILNREVIFNDNPRSHVTGLKNLEPIGLGLDRCVDCGFCEAICPSAKKGLSPRQRIYVLRAIMALRKQGDEARAAEYERNFRDLGIDLCATDGLCSTACPLQIDTASAMRACRHKLLPPTAKGCAGIVRRHVATAAKTASTLLSLAHAAEGLFPHVFNQGLGRLSGRLTGMTLPDLREVHLCGSSPVPRPKAPAARQNVVYFPSCAVRAMGYSGDAGRAVDPLMDTALRLLDKAGFNVIIPENVQNLCCGKAFETKGMQEEADAAAAALDKALLDASCDGSLPIMCDTSPCLARMRKTLDSRLQMYEPVEFTLRFLVDRLTFIKKHHKVAIHPTCSTRALGLAEKMRSVALLCSEEVVLPEGIFCCGFSGDKGFARPELNAAALAGLAGQIADCEAGYSTSRTCEVGLTLHGGKTYSSLLYLLDECSVPRS